METHLDSFHPETFITVNSPPFRPVRMG